MSRMIFIIAVSTILFSCSSVRIIKPLHKGDKRITGDFGGPLINFKNIPVVLPLSSFGLAYGFSNNTSAQFSVHTTTLLFGTAHTELMLNTKIKELGKTGFSINYGAYYFLGLREKISAFYPLTDLNFYWNYSKMPRYLYTSLTQLFELHRYKAFRESIDKRIIPTLSIGHRWEKETFEWGIELKYINFIKDNRNIVVDYIAPLHFGTLGFSISFLKKF